MVLRTHEPWLRRVLRNRLGDKDLVDEAFQEVGLALAKSESRPQEESRLAAWLYRVAVRQSLLIRRRLGRLRRRMEAVGRRMSIAGDTGDGDPLQWLLHVEREQAVRRAFARLSDLDREILLLKYNEKWTYGEMARRLGVTVHTIEHRLFKAKSRLRRLLQEEDIEVGT